MSLLNYTSPYVAPPSPPVAGAGAAPHYYQPPQQFSAAAALRPPPQGPYSYPAPEKPFLREEYEGAQPAYRGPPFAPQAHEHGGRPTFTKVTDEGTKTKVHAVIDYDYEDEDEGLEHYPPVTPIQGPIFIKNGSVPVVPLYSHPVLHNGTFVQIPILWTALSVALGLELQGQYIRGVPCIKKNQQLYCPTAGNSYPLDRIELFIDENKALMKRMYGEFDMPDYDSRFGASGTKRKRSTKPGVPDVHFDPGPEPYNGGETMFGKARSPRQNFRSNQSSESGRVDACESKIEIVTPYWASNSAGKIRAIVNTQHFEQAIHQEVCTKNLTKRCSGDCGCEQKYKWHRLLAYDPDNDCRGIFMDWFLFPSCCVCRCSPN